CTAPSWCSRASRCLTWSPAYQSGRPTPARRPNSSGGGALIRPPPKSIVRQEQPETGCFLLSSVELQVLFVVFVDALDVRVGFGEGDGFGEGVDVGVTGGEEPTVHGELGSVVRRQGGEDTVGVARQAFA